MDILVACEESQAVTKELRARGHNAFSCDLMDCSGGFPGWHIKADVLPLLNGHCSFITQDGICHSIEKEWDMIIAFPPCTHLAVSGARHFEKKRKDGLQFEAISFFNKILNADCEKIAVENPINIIGSSYIKQWFPGYADMPKQSQIIQPFQFGDPARKSTCLWLKGLEKLKPTNIVKPEIVSYTCKNGKRVTFSKDYVSGGGNNSIRRSKTYPGIAKAMAEQWTRKEIERRAKQ